MNWHINTILDEDKWAKVVNIKPTTLDNANKLFYDFRNSDVTYKII